MGCMQPTDDHASVIRSKCGYLNKYEPLHAVNYIYTGSEISQHGCYSGKFQT